MQLVPPQLVASARALIASQGGNPGAINDNGDLDPGGILEMLFNEVEVKTSLTPTVRFPISASGAPADPATQELLNSLRPTVVFSGPAGSFEVAPYGSAQGTPTSWLPIIAIGGAVVLGIGYLVWKD